jgi:hypothetical protein
MVFRNGKTLAGSYKKIGRNWLHACKEYDVVRSE